MNNSLKSYLPEQKTANPKIEIVKELPKSLNPKAIERAVAAFVRESHVLGDEYGVYEQTLQSIVGCTVDKGGNFWLAEHNGEVAAYVIGRIVKEIDNRLTYWVSQAWVNPIFRGKPVVKDEWWRDIKNYAKSYFCKHLVIVSSRNAKAYERWFGTGIKEYAKLMMEDLEG